MRWMLTRNAFCAGMGVLRVNLLERNAQPADKPSCITKQAKHANANPANTSTSPQYPASHATKSAQPVPAPRNTNASPAP
jgi:hypothetical protein